MPIVTIIAFHSTNLFLFSSHHIPTNSKAPFSAYNHSHTTHNFSICSDGGLMLETSIMKLLMVADLRYQLSC